MSEGKPVVLVDMDDTSVDMTKVWRERYYERTGLRLNPSEWHDFNLAKVYPKEVTRVLFDIIAEPGFFRHLPPMEGVVEVLQEFTDQGLDVVMLTASEGCAMWDKQDWVCEYLPFVSQKNVIHAHRKDLVFGDFLIDDAIHNLVPSPAKYKIVMDRPWNRSLADVPRAYAWEDVRHLVLGKSPLALGEAGV